MKDLNYQLTKLCKNNRDGSFSTQATRRRILDLIANQLRGLGYRRMQATSLKPKHIHSLVSLWKDQGISIGTFKNRLSVLRWWARKVNKENLLARNNDHYGLARRQNIPSASKAIVITSEQINRISDPYTRLSLRLQQAFGLRREEAIKFSPSYAIRNEHIRLRPSWTKGGRARDIPIRTGEQRKLLEEVTNFARGGALIPPDQNYVQQRNRYDRQVRNASIKNPHGLRHAYAQQRYEELTGWKAPLAGGPASKSLRSVQRALDKLARETIAEELGHSREQISATYLGR